MHPNPNPDHRSNSNVPGERWWRDGGSDFTVPVPGARKLPKVKDNAIGVFEDELRCALLVLSLC